MALYEHSHANFKKFFVSEIDKWRNAVKKTKLKLDRFTAVGTGYPVDCRLRCCRRFQGHYAPAGPPAPYSRRVTRRGKAPRGYQRERPV